VLVTDNPTLALDAVGPSTLYLLETSGSREHKLARRVGSLGATTVHLVLRAPCWDLCLSGLATTNVQ
jgi:hypothetical protein